MIGIVDYGLGNLSSIRNMLEKIGFNSTIVSKPRSCDRFCKLILPGVGHFDHAMKQIKVLGLSNFLSDHALGLKIPILGICLGAQILGCSSEEGSLEGLGWIQMNCRKFRLPSNLPVPNMGWNFLSVSCHSPLLSGLDNSSRFYFAHSYFMECASPADSLASSFYGSKYTSVVGRGNIYGVQFHPEKSHRFGMQLMSNFASLP